MKLIFIPFGSQENHGPHNNSSCDFIIALGICEKLSRIFGGCLPKKFIKKGVEGIPPTKEYKYNKFYLYFFLI
jgi:creatinine amidohydrolase/Fe(II)-dependent formamide hydrolase-like protein